MFLFSFLLLFCALFFLLLKFVREMVNFVLVAVARVSQKGNLEKLPNHPAKISNAASGQICSIYNVKLVQMAMKIQTHSAFKKGKCLRVEQRLLFFFFCSLFFLRLEQKASTAKSWQHMKTHNPSFLHSCPPLFFSSLSIST